MISTRLRNLNYTLTFEVLVEESVLLVCHDLEPLEGVGQTLAIASLRTWYVSRVHARGDDSFKHSPFLVLQNPVASRRFRGLSPMP